MADSNARSNSFSAFGFLAIDDLITCTSNLLILLGVEPRTNQRRSASGSGVRTSAKGACADSRSTDVLLAIGPRQRGPQGLRRHRRRQLPARDDERSGDRHTGNLAADEASPQVTSILGYASPLGNGHAVYRALQAHAKNFDLSAVTTRHLGSAANVIGAPELGLGFLIRSSAMAREEGRLGELPRTLFAQAWAQVEVGHWDDALAAAAEGVTLAEETGGRHWVAASKIVEARVAGMRGDMAAFIARSTEAERIALPLGASFLLAMLQLARTTTALGAGRPLEAFDHIQRMFDPADPAYNSSIQFYAASDLVEAAIAADRRDVAVRMLADIVTATNRKPVPWVGANLAYCKALVAAPERSGTAFDAASREDLKDWPFLRGRCLLAQGEYLRRSRRPAEARAPLRAAAQTFDALGAVPWSERAWNDLRAAGEGSRPSETLLASVLSPRELQIAQLAAAGLTNKEIGRRLNLSHRTVGYHLHKIFPKTGVTARYELRDVLN
ncbi:helix-turn-helix transcriptional regulator [Sphingomonas sp. M1A8_2b]